MKAFLSAVLDRILAEPVLDVALVSDVLVILGAIHTGQPISNALILDAAQTLLAIFARSKVTPVSKVAAAAAIPPATPAA